MIVTGSGMRFVLATLEVLRSTGTVIFVAETREGTEAVGTFSVSDRGRTRSR